MRLQVEITTASRTSAVAVACARELAGLALAERQAFAQRHRRGLVGDAQREQLAHAGADSRSGSWLRRRRRPDRPAPSGGALSDTLSSSPRSRSMRLRRIAMIAT